MREILYKARRVDNGEWVEGYYFLLGYDGVPTPCIGIEPLSANDYGEIYRDCYYEIDPATLCQHTGLTDKNGVKIFEADRICYQSENHTVYGIVRFGKIPNNDGKTKHIGCYVEWEDDGANMWNVWWRCDIVYWIAEEKCVVCGSILPPELIGQTDTPHADPLEARTRGGEG